MDAYSNKSGREIGCNVGNSFGYNQEILGLLSKNKKREEPKPQEPEVKQEASKPLVPVKAENTGTMVNLRGIEITSSGQMSKTKFFSALQINAEDYPDIQFTPEEAKKVSMAMQAMSNGLTASIPLICKGPTCPFALTCPYQKVNKAPIGRGCLVEQQLIELWVRQYVEEFQVNFNSITEVRMVSELAEFDIYEMRINTYLAEKHPTLLQDVISFDSQGAQVVNLEISRAFDLKERIKKNRMKVLEALVATRKDKIKIMSDAIGGNSTAERITNLKQKLEELRGDIKNLDYIDAQVVSTSTKAT